MKRVLVLIVLLAILGFAYLFFGNNNVVPSQHRLIIATTIFPTYDIAKNVLGDKVNLVQILPVGASPHTYEPTVQDQLKLQGVDVLFVVGHGLDDFAVKLAKSGNSNVQIVSLDKYVVYTEDEMDPHYFVSVNGARSIARVIEETMSGLDGGNQQYYQNNAQDYLARLEDLLTNSRRKLLTLSVPLKIVTFHNAFSYFADELGIDIVATLEPFPGKKPTIEYLSNIEDIIKKQGVIAVFSEPQLSGEVVESISKDLGIKIYTLDPLGGYDARNSFIANYKANVDTIIESYSQND